MGHTLNSSRGNADALSMNNTSPTKRRQPRGFSLIEMLTVVTCLAVISYLVVSSTSDSDLPRLRSAARLLVADIEYAQLQSMGNSVDPCVLVFDLGDSTYHVARVSDPATPIDDPGSGLAFVTAYGNGRASGLDGVTFSVVDVGGDTELSFDAFGAPDQVTDATITLACGDDEITVRVDGDTGAPSIE